MEDFKNGGSISAEGRKLRPRKKVSFSNDRQPVGADHRSYGEHKSYERSSYGDGERRSYDGSERSGFSGERKSYGDGEQRSFSGERKSYGDGEQRSFSGERRSYGERSSNNGGERRSYGERKPYGERRSYDGGEQRSFYGERKSYGDGERRSYNSGDRKPYGERRAYGDGEQRSFGGERRSFGSGDGERRSYNGGERSFNGGERRSYGDRKPYGERKSYGSGDGERRPAADRPNHSGERSFNGGERRSFGERKSFGERPGFRNGERKAYANGDGERRGFGERKSFGASRPYSGGAKRGGFGKPQRGGFRKRFDPHFDESETSGINKMISSKPQLDSAQLSDFDYAPTPIKDEIRLNKFIANSGVCSRREADTFIQAGVVTVNGEVVTELGTKVNVVNDDIRFNGERLKGETKVYIVMNKPKGYVTTSSDPHAEKTVMDLLKACPTRVFPVGRLDKSTTGVLMFTNDGEIAEKLTHPSYDKKKIYQVLLDRELTQEDFDKILEGVALSDGEVKADELQFIEEKDHRKLGIEIHSGKNRIVRRIFETLGYDVKALDRVYFAGLTKKGVGKGEWRYLSESEVNILKMGAYI